MTLNETTRKELDLRLDAIEENFELGSRIKSIYELIR